MATITVNDLKLDQGLAERDLAGVSGGFGMGFGWIRPFIDPKSISSPPAAPMIFVNELNQNFFFIENQHIDVEQNAFVDVDAMALNGSNQAVNVVVGQVGF